MLLRIFLEYIRKTKKLPQGHVFCFFGREYPSLFFYYIVLFFKKNNIHIEHLSCGGGDIARIKALLATMSFTGMITYFLEDFHILTTKKQQELLEYMTSYTGPHCLLLFSTNTLNELRSSQFSTSVMNNIALPETIASRDLSLVRFLVSDLIQDKTVFALQLAQVIDTMSLDSACLFAYYELVLGSNVEDFFSRWLMYIATPTSSLFVLSQYFFNKKVQLFFRQWAIISPLYAPQFWVTFWADQVWRAYVFCDVMKQKNYVDAKKAQYKLPFSFINRDWSSYSLVELCNAHDFLTIMDFRLKNGGSEIGLEHFYIRFFGNAFK
ncbi:MAG TPA: hypothetical protein VLB80_01890 [Candidatus Babeliales bacterium]|nr:hypothetical protein [Candidatus Babeliales bacterium]